MCRNDFLNSNKTSAEALSHVWDAIKHSLTQRDTISTQDGTDFFNPCGIASSCTTLYNPQGNVQVERYNGIICKTVSLALKTQNLNIRQWEKVLDESLHAIQSLLSTTTNVTPYERMFCHMRNSFYGQSLPMCLSTPGPVF